MRASHTILGLILAMSSPAFAQTLEIVNNQPFDVHMPIRLRGAKLDAGAKSGIAQADGNDVVVMIDAKASTSDKRELSTTQGQPALPVTLKADGDGVSIDLAGSPMGRLSWGVVVKPSEKKGKTPASTKQDFAASFKPLSLKFQREFDVVPAVGNPAPIPPESLFKTLRASGTMSGLRLDIVLHAYRTGFLDSHVTLTNESAPQKDVYAAVVCRWEQPKIASQTLCYDNRRQELPADGYSPFRAGEGRQLYVQRGVDWVNARTPDGAGVVWLNDFTPGFTFHRDASETKNEKTGVVTKLPARWVGANAAHLGQEVQTKDGSLYSITEIARPNLKQYEARLEDNILPGKDEPLTFTSRLAFEQKALSDDDADHQFVAYAGFNPQQITTVGAKVQFGAPYTRVGTNYFPYSTLGENFVDYRMEGMSTEGYWPLAPQTVLHWDKFADDIRRDLRILKAMGFELVRLHHLEVMWDKDKKGNEYIPAAKRLEYLDFLFAEIEKLGLKALIDVKLPPKDVAELVTRYRKLLDGVEYDNEVLIFQIADEDPKIWKDVYDAVKQAAPDMPFHLTAHTNMGAFDRLAQMGAKVDKIGQHAYMDGVEPIPSSRDFSLAAGNYAAKHDKEPIITEWNWRFLTRMPMEDRAKVYGPIFGNVFEARCMPTVYQFQFQDSLAMNPTTLKGIRRYELLLLSRRPKPEATVMMELIGKYGPPDSGVRRIGVEHLVVEMGENNQGNIVFHVTNKTDSPMPVVLSVEGPQDITATLMGRRETVLEPGKPLQVPVKLAFADAAKALPGFYHVFLRVNAADDTLRYGWAEVRRPAGLKLDHTENAKVAYGPGALDFDFNRPLTVVYTGDEKAVMELEAAWTVFITLESATGRPVEIYQASDLAKVGGEANRNIVLVTQEKGAKPSVRVDGNKLIVTGGSEQDVTAACMDLVLRYWKNAKDAGARKVGLVEAAKAGAGGKTDLD